MTNRTVEAAEIAKLAERQGYPAVTRLGEYVFFAWLAFWAASPVYAICAWLDVPYAIKGMATNLAGFAIFLTLRDMTRRARATLSEKGEQVS